MLGELAWLSEPFRGPADLVNSTEWKIKHTSYWLPNDLVEIMDVSFNDRNVVGAQNTGKMQQIPMRMSIEMGLQTQRTSTKPTAYIPGEPFLALAPDSGISAGLSVATTAVALAGGETTVPPGTYYTGFSILYGTPDTGWEGLIPESDILWSPTPVVVSAARKLVSTVSNLVNMNMTGMHLKQYIGVDNGIGEIAAWEVGTSANGFPNPWLPPAGFQITGAEFPGINGFLMGGNNRRVTPRVDHSQKRIHFFPRPQGIDQTVVAPLDAGDFVEWDFKRTYFDLIVDKVLSDLYLMLNNPVASQLHEKKAKDRMVLLETRYGSEQDFLAVRRNSWRLSPTGIPGWNRNLVTFR